MELTLTIKDRLILANQYQILELLDNKQSKYYANLQTILMRGYVGHYSELVTAFNEDQLTAEQCAEVRDILQMYRMLGNAYKELSDKTGIDPEHIKFAGFDQNEEPTHYSYASFLIEDQRRWQEAAGDINSHFPNLVTYRDMLREWKASKHPHELTREDVLRIIRVGPKFHL